MSGTTVSATNAVTTTKTLNTNVQSNQNSLYNIPMGLTMANDFFGSQAFGKQTVQQNTPLANETPSVFVEEPKNEASAVLQAYMNETNLANQKQQNTYNTQKATQTNNIPPATVQDYIAATQIANQFANSNNILISPYDAYHQNDFFAQNNLPIYNKNAQLLSQQQSISYLS